MTDHAVSEVTSLFALHTLPGSTDSKVRIAWLPKSQAEFETGCKRLRYHDVATQTNGHRLSEYPSNGNHDACCFQDICTLEMILNQECIGQSSSLKQICFKSLLSCDAELFYQEIIRNHVPSQLPLTPTEHVNVKDSQTAKLPMISYCGADVPNPETCLYLCNYTTWLQVRSLVQFMSMDCFTVFGSAHLCLLVKQSHNTFVWRLRTVSAKEMLELKQGRGYIWFWMPNKSIRQFQWLVSQRLELYSGSLLCAEPFRVIDDQTEHLNTRAICMVLDNMDDLVFFTNLSSDYKQSENVLSKYVTKFENIDDFGGVSKFCDDTRAQESSTVVIKQEHESVETHCLSFLSNHNSHEIEIHDMDLSQIKREVQEDGECKISAEQLCMDEVLNTPIYEKLNSLQNLFTKYTGIAKRGGFHVMASEPMLIVQCPGCCVEYRGLSNRMLRLINHIRMAHDHRYIKRYTNQIEKRYRSLIELAKRRLEGWHMSNLHK